MLDYLRVPVTGFILTVQMSLWMQFRCQEQDYELCKSCIMSYTAITLNHILIIQVQGAFDREPHTFLPLISLQENWNVT